MAFESFLTYVRKHPFVSAIGGVFTVLFFAANAWALWSSEPLLRSIPWSERMIVSAAQTISIVGILLGVALLRLVLRNQAVIRKDSGSSISTGPTKWDYAIGLAAVIAFVGVAFTFGRPAYQLVQRKLEQTQGALDAALADADIQRKSAEAKDTRLNDQQTRIDSLTNELAVAARALGERRATQVSGTPKLLPGPRRLLTRPNIERYDEEMKKFRDELGLRPIIDEQLGLPFSRMPIGTFYFLGIVSIKSGQPFSDTRPERAKVERRTNSGTNVELQTRMDGEIHMIVFVDDDTLATVANLDGQTEHNIVASASPTDTRTALISLPIDRILTSDYRQTTRWVLDLTVR